MICICSEKDTVFAHFGTKVKKKIKYFFDLQ